MKTLKTISTALSLTLLVSAVSAPAVMPTKMDLVKGAFKSAKKSTIDFLGSRNGKIAAAAVVAAGLSYAGYKAYNYFTAEEVAADEANNETVQNVVPTPVEVTAPVETPAVEAPKTEVKAVKKAKRNPFAKRTAKRNVAAKAKAPKAKVAAKAQVAKAPKAKVTRNAGCKNGRCGVRRSR